MSVLVSTSLVSDSNSSNLVAFDVFNCFFDAFDGVGPYFKRIMFNETRRRIVLLMLALVGRGNLAFTVKYHTAGTAGALVY
jgi:hypothetical protein